MEFPDPDVLFGADVAHWQRFLRSRGFYGGRIDGQYGPLTKEASVKFQQEERLHQGEPVDDAVLEAARSLGYEIPQLNPPGEYFHRDGHIELSSHDRGRVERLAYLYYLWTGERITVKSGTRTPRSQAEDMYDNWYFGRNTRTHYKNREAEREIRQAYNASIAAHESRSATVNAMTKVIETQVRRHDYISLHLIGRAVDVRSHGMSPDDKVIFEELGAKLPGVRVLHEENHYHLQFQ
jgi:peptidoglycan hydrolase-like protein with peptidoglycan-binding domain